jgi:lyso-ornithine lipid O-acyltransferase
MPSAMSGQVIAGVRVLLFVAWTSILLCIRLAVLPFGINSAPLRLVFFRGLCWIFGIDIIVHGTPATARPLLIASNHISYLDIIAFGAVSELEFVSKAEVADWPVFGTLAKLADTVFIERRRSHTLVARRDMANHLAADRMLVFFPEATSGDGNRLLPFKSALFTAAGSIGDSKDVTIQPAAIAYTRLNGLPVGCGWRSFFAWYGDMDLTNHAWRFLQLGRTTVEIAFLPPIDVGGNMDRKTLAAESERAVRRGFSRLLCGQPIE